MTKSTTSRFQAGLLAASVLLLPAIPWAPAGAVPGTVVPAPLAAQEVHRLNGPQVAIYNLAGAVQVVSGNGSQVVVEVSRGGADASRLSIETGRIGDHETLRVLYPDDRVVYREGGRGSNTTMRVRRDGTFFGGRGGGDRVRISGRGGGLEAHADLTVRVPQGVEVAVNLGVGEGRVRDIEAGVTFRTGAGNVDVADVEGRVDVDTGSGAVTISDVRGEVNVDTGSGSVVLEQLTGSRVSVDTGSGRIGGRDLTVEELVVDTGSGRIDLEDVSAARIGCDTGSGAVRLDLTEDVDRLMVDTGSGSVVVAVPAGFGAVLDLSSGSGRVSVDVPDVEAVESKRRHFRGSVGDGDGRVVIDTGSGGITLRRS